MCGSLSYAREVFVLKICAVKERNHESLAVLPGAIASFLHGSVFKHPWFCWKKVPLASGKGPNDYSASKLVKLVGKAAANEKAAN